VSKQSGLSISAVPSIRSDPDSAAAVLMPAQKPWHLRLDAVLTKASVPHLDAVFEGGGLVLGGLPDGGVHDEDDQVWVHACRHLCRNEM